VENTISDWAVTVVLADAAQVYDGKLSILGGGWQTIRAMTAPFAIAILIAVPWSETNRRHKMLFTLRTADGQPVAFGEGAGSVPLQIGTEFEVGRPPGFPQGSRFNVPIAVNVAPLPLQPGSYVWTWSLDSAERDEWRLPFEVRP